MTRLAATVASLLMDGISFGMILFLISAGLTVTLGVMRVVNLAHCGFAMVAGYLALAIVHRWDVGLLAALPLAAAATIALGVILERTLYRWIYATSQLGQVLMTIGLVFMMVASMNLAFGSAAETLPIPPLFSGTWQSSAFALPRYRAFLVAVSVVIGIALWAILEFTDFGAKLRASVDNPRMARCIGVNVPRIFSATFAGGVGLAAVAGILGTQMLPLEPWYGLKHLVPVLMVVAVGGLGSLKGSLYAALLLGVIDTFGRYYLPDAGAFVIYVTAATILLWRPEGLIVRN